MMELTADSPDAQPGPALKREKPLVPEDSVASRALVIVIAIMTFLACLTAGAALLVSDASQGWRDAVGRSVTIQIKPRAGLDLDLAVTKATEAARKAPGVSSAKAMSLSDSEHMLEPWLGQGIDLSQLPIPRLIVVEMQQGADSDLAPLREALASASPSASVDDQSVWLSRLNTMAFRYLHSRAIPGAFHQGRIPGRDHRRRSGSGVFRDGISAFSPLDALDRRRGDRGPVRRVRSGRLWLHRDRCDRRRHRCANRLSLTVHRFPPPARSVLSQGNVAWPF